MVSVYRKSGTEANMRRAAKEQKQENRSAGNRHKKNVKQLLKRQEEARKHGKAETAKQRE